MFYCPWAGNKRTENNKIKEKVFSLIDEKKIKNIVEPFCGTGSFSKMVFEKYGNKLNYHLNDIDKNLIELFEHVKSHGNALDMFAKLRLIAQQVLDKPKDERYKHLTELIDVNSVGGWVLKKRLCRYGKVFGENRTAKLSYRSGKYDTFIPHVTFYNMDFIDFLKKMDKKKNTLYYFDPPYIASDNNTYADSGCVYNENIDNNVYAVLDKFFNSKKYTIAVLESFGLLKYIYIKYVKKEYNKNYSQNHKKTKHTVFANF